MFHRVLVANRGEIAARIIRTLRELGVGAVAIAADDDLQQPHARLADRVAKLGPGGPRETYLDIDKVVEAAKANDCDAVHPGYGFLSERAGFARALEKAGIAWIGPPPRALELLGDKAAALQLARELGVPTTPGSDGAVGSLDEATSLAEEMGYPLVVKAVHGGGGMGMVRVDRLDELPAAWEAAREQAALAFGSDEVLLERWWTRARHVEVQVAFDAGGAGVHMFERECSIQRRNQKLIEEAPAPSVDRALREALTSDALKLCAAAGVEGLATVEFLVPTSGGSERGSAAQPTHDEPAFVFNEVNPRLQVEHTVTEMVTGEDLVAWQLQLAAAERLPKRQKALAIDGWAVQARVNAEDVLADFAPSPDVVTHAHVPEGDGLRVDHAIVPGAAMPAQYDSLVAKVIGHGPDRDAAIDVVRDGLARLRIGGVPTTAGFLHHLLDQPPVRAGQLHTKLVDRDVVAAYRELVHGAMTTLVLHTRPGERGTVELDGHLAEFVLEEGELRIDGVATSAVGEAVSRTEVEAAGRVWEGRAMPELPRRALTEGGSTGHVKSPIPGTVVEVLVAEGERVKRGTPLVVLDAMKMRNRIEATGPGVVERVRVGEGDRVAKGDVLVEMGPAPGG